MKKRVAINLLNFADSQIAGAGIFARNLLRAWFRQSGKSDIVIYHSAAVDAREIFGLAEFPEITYRAVNVNSFVARIIYEQLILAFQLKDFDVYFSPTPVMPLIGPYINKRLKHIVTIHDMIPFFVPNKYGRIRSVYVRLISSYGARLASTVITVSENSKRDICTLTKIQPEKVIVVYNFIPGDSKKVEVSYDHFFVSVSTIEPGKNIENTMRGFRAFLDSNNHHDFKFYWIGKIGWGYTRESLESMISSLNLSGKFSLLGYVDTNEKERLLRECYSMVYLSHYEGFGLPVLEAFHFNKPSVASRNSSLPEVVGNAGVLCDKENVSDIAAALVEIVDNLPRYVGEIPVQLAKFSEQSQLVTFLKTLEAEPR